MFFAKKKVREKTAKICICWVVFSKRSLRGKTKNGQFLKTPENFQKFVRRENESSALIGGRGRLHPNTSVG